jgi:hypothetical protein
VDETETTLNPDTKNESRLVTVVWQRRAGAGDEQHAKRQRV